MPSAEETTYLIEVMPDTRQDFLARDVDLLVSQIKENLRLSSLKAKSSVSHKNRPSPYRIPSRSWADPSTCEICAPRNNNNNNGNHDRHIMSQHYHHHHHHHHHHLHHDHKRTAVREEDDPYELLKELLREGGLIKEAVKRLQANLDELENSEEEEEEEHGVYRRKPYFYESEDEPLPSMFQQLDM